MTNTLEYRDELVRAVMLGGKARLLAVTARDSVSELVRVHALSPTMTVAAGRWLICGIFAGADLKGETDAVNVTVQCDGPVEALTTVCDYGNRVRQSVLHPHLELPEGENYRDLSALFGKGMMRVTRTQGEMRPWMGTCDLLSGNAGDDFAYYLTTSEQVNSFVSLSVEIDRGGVVAAGGLLVQALPGCEEEDLDYLEVRAQGMPPLSFFLREGFTAAQLIELFAGRSAVEYLATEQVAYSCPCSRSRMSRNLIALGREQLSELAADPEGIELVCWFCQTRYKFSRAEVSELLAAR